MFEFLKEVNFLQNNLPALLVAIPLIMSIFCALFKSPKIAWTLAFLAVISSFIISILLYQQINGMIGEVRYFMGGWEAPYGIEYRIDGLNLIFIILTTFFALILFPYAYNTVKAEIDPKKHGIFYCLFLLCFAGLLGILSTNDIFNLYVFLEISSLATYVLISLGRDRRALTAAFSYLILGTIGATFILIAIGLLYIMTGTLNLTDIAGRIADIKDTAPIQGAFAFLCIGVFLKIALFPLHIWLTNAYTYAPAFVSTFLSCTATKTSVYIFFRFIFFLFGYEYSFEIMPLPHLLIILSSVAIIAGSLSAIYNPNIKRIFAFSSVSQMGYIILAASLATPIGLAAAIVHVINHAFAKSLVFASAGAIVIRNSKSEMRLHQFSGLGKKMPVAAAGILVGGLSLIGVPATVGFISKWYILTAMLQTHPYLVPVLIISSLLAVIYVWKIVETLYFKSPESNKDNEKIDPLAQGKSVNLTIFILIFLNIFFGIFTALTWDNALLISEKIFTL